MFYSDIILAKKGPLANIWLAAHLSKRLSKNQIFDTNIEGSVEAIVNPHVALALRVSGHLLLGVVRIYSRKVKYLYNDVNFARSSLSREYNNPNVDLPTGSNAGSLSINLAGGFGNFDEEDDSSVLLYNAPDVSRWAKLAVYQHMDNGDADDDALDASDMQGMDSGRPTEFQEQFTDFGDQGGDGFGGSEMSGFDFDAEPEVGRARAPEDRQSLGFDSSPVPAAEESHVFDDDQDRDNYAPVDDSVNFDEPSAGGFGNNTDFSLADDDAFPTDAAEASTTGNNAANEGAAPARTMQRVPVKHDAKPTLDRKQLKARSRKARPVVPVRERNLQIWDHTRHPSRGAPLSAGQLDALLLAPSSGIAGANTLRMFAAAVDGTARITAGPTPTKRGRDSISNDDPDDVEDVEVARRKSEGPEAADVSALDNSGWGGNSDMPDDSMQYDAPIDDPVFDDSGMAKGNAGGHNHDLEEALLRHQGSDGTDAQDGPGEAGETTDDAPSEDTLHPRTLVMMREINRSLGVEAAASPKSGGAAPAVPDKKLEFGEMISGFRKAPAAAAFFEVLALKTRGFIDVDQSMPFSSISIGATGTFVDPV